LLVVFVRSYDVTRRENDNLCTLLFCDTCMTMRLDLLYYCLIHFRKNFLKIYGHFYKMASFQCFFVENSVMYIGIDMHFRPMKIPSSLCALYGCICDCLWRIHICNLQFSV